MILTPEFIFRKVEAIRPEFLARQGIKALVLDVDNTLTADNSQVLEESVQAWLEEMGLAEVEGLGAVKVLHLTGRGEDVARGRVSVPGVKRPRAGA